MKIIGKTKDGYLVETTEREIAQALGFDWESDKVFREITHGARDQYSSREGLKIGGEIQIGVSNRYLDSLRNKELSIRSAAKTLHELADLMQAGVPTAIVPPPEQGGSGGD